MFKLVICTALGFLPIAIPCGMLCFLAARWSLQRKNRMVRVAARAGCLLCLTALAAGIIYGALRFSGVIVFAGDHAISYNWFDTSYRDEGFEYIYACGIVFAGIVTALLFEKRKGKQTGTEMEA